MRSTPPTSALATAVQVVRGLPPADGGLGSSVGDEVCLLAELLERTRVAMLTRLAVLDAGGAVASDGSGSLESWLVASAGMARAQAGREAWLCRRLFRDGDAALPATAAALQRGELTVEHARVIAVSTATLPVQVVAQAEAVLVAAAGRLAPAQLAVAGRRLRHVLVGDHANRAEIARGDRFLRLTPALFGMWAIDGLVDAETGAALQAAFDSVLARPAGAGDPQLDLDVADPGAVAPTAAPPRPSYAQRRADALGEIVRGWLAAGGAPIAGGIRPQLVVTVDLATLTGDDPRGVGVVRPDSRTGDGTEIGARCVQRIGCDAGLTLLVGRGQLPPPRDAGRSAVRAADGARQSPTDGEPVEPSLDPAMLAGLLAGIAPALGGPVFEPLALGRTARLVSPAQRLALNARDRGCVAPGCTSGPERCQAHHLVFWAAGGSSDLSNLALVCGWHHHLVHEGGWLLSREPGIGTIELRPPPSPP